LSNVFLLLASVIGDLSFLEAYTGTIRVQASGRTSVTAAAFRWMQALLDR
jgi:hypothetical protein